MRSEFPRLRAVIAVAAGLSTAGCGDDELRLDSPQARYMRDWAETALSAAEFQARAREADTPPGKVKRVECSGGEDSSPRGDFKCAAVTDTGVRVQCEGFVTNGRVASVGCSPARLPGEAAATSGGLASRGRR